MSEWTLPAEVSDALDALEQAGFAAYLAGGCVRDLLRGVSPHDYDLTTDALPEQTRTVFADRRVLPTGLKHGTVTLLAGPYALEITTFRTDGTYTDGRRPDSVTFTRSIGEDLRRRDFTVNAMAYSPVRGLVDPFGGRADLQKKLLRCVGDPSERFREDALRVLRGARFSSCLGFSVEPATARAMEALTPRLALVSAERITAELLKLLCGVDVGRVLDEFRELFAFLLPELRPCFGFDQRNRHHCFDVYTHILRVVSAVPPDPLLRVAALFHDVAKPACFVFRDGRGHFPSHAERSAEIADATLRRWKTEKRLRGDVCTLVRLHDRWLKREPASAAPELLAEVPPHLVEPLLALMEADATAKAEADLAVAHVRALRDAVATFLASHPCLTLHDLAVNGDDLLSLGFPPGPAVGDALRALLDRVRVGDLPNDRDALLHALKNPKNR